MAPLPPRVASRRRQRNRSLWAAVATTAAFVVALFSSRGSPPPSVGCAFVLGGAGARTVAVVASRRLVAARGALANVGSATTSPSTTIVTHTTQFDPISGDLDVSGLPSARGVYAIIDSYDRLQYIGISSDIKRTISGHATIIGSAEASALIAHVRYLEMNDQSEELVKATWRQWINDQVESGESIPCGNLPDNARGADPRWRSRRGQANPASPLNLRNLYVNLSNSREAYDAVRRAVSEHPIVLFMKGTPQMPQCGFSARVVSILRQRDITYAPVNVLDVEANPGVREAVKEYSSWPTIPQLYVNGKLVGGADIVGELHQSGELKGILAGTPSPDLVASSRLEVASRGSVGFPESSRDVHLVNDKSRPIASHISELLNASLRLQGLRIIDESEQHNGDAGALEMGLTTESHFRLEIIASDFDGLSSLLRQQKVFDILKDVMPRIHALSVVTKTAMEA